MCGVGDGRFLCQLVADMLELYNLFIMGEDYWNNSFCSDGNYGTVIFGVGFEEEREIRFFPYYYT